MISAQSARDLRRLRIRVFYVLTFVQNHRLPANRCENLTQTPELAVIDHVKIGVAKLLMKSFQLARRPNLHSQSRSKAISLSTPIIHYALGTDDKAR